MTSSTAESSHLSFRPKKQFALLFRLSIGRVLHGTSSDSPEGELDISLGVVLSLLALPGAFYAILLLEKYSTLLQWMQGSHEVDPFAASMPDEYFFIVLSMAITTLVAVWRWDSIFPDRRDYSNLVPLPISIRDIFLANFVAIVILAAALAVDVNAVSVILFPLVVAASANSFSFFAQFVAVHACVVLLASCFSFFGVFVIVGILMAALPHGAFRRISLYLRSIIVAGTVAMVSTSFVVPMAIRQLPRTYVKFLPPVWFLAMCQLVRGRANPSFAALGRVAFIASASMIAIACVVYTISYRRSFSKVLETADTIPASTHEGFSWIFPLLDRTILRSPFQRAGYRFAIKTLLRSEAHGLVLSGFVGLGIVTASQFIFSSLNEKTIHSVVPTAELLAIPLILSYCIILGVRFVFEIPTQIRANWIFQVCSNSASRECMPLARKIILSFVFPWVFALVLPVYAHLWGWRVGLLESAITAIWSLLLSQLLLLRFRKIPFTCSYPVFQNSAVVLVLLCVLGFFAYAVLTSNVEYWVLSKPLLIPVLVIFAVVAWYVFSHLRNETEGMDVGIVFEEKASTEFELLNLGHGN